MGSLHRASWGTCPEVGTVRVLVGNARDCRRHATTDSAILGTQEPTVPFMDCSLSAAWKCSQAPPTERADVLLPPDEQRGGSNGSPAFGPQPTHRASACRNGKLRHHARNDRRH